MRLYLGLPAVFIVGLLFFGPVFKHIDKKQKAIAIAQPPAARPGQVRTTHSLGPLSFAKVQGTDLSLYLPASVDEIYGIGYHQAFNPKSYSLIPSVNFLQGGDQIKAEVRSKTGAGHPMSFVMSSRGRRSAPTSSVDIAVNANTVITSPVDGVVADIVPYRLYGRENDFRIEIVAAGYPQFKIAIIHIDGIMITKGQQVTKGVTKLAKVRHLGINSQVMEYVGSPLDHVHIQVNPLESKGKVLE